MPRCKHWPTREPTVLSGGQRPPPPSAGTHMTWPNQKPGIRQGRGEDRSIHPSPSPAETVLHTQCIRGQPAAEMFLARPPASTQILSPWAFPCPCNPSSTWPWCPALTPRARGTQHLPEAELPSSQGRNSRRLSLGITCFFLSWCFIPFFVCLSEVTVSCGLQVKVIIWKQILKI